MPNPYSLPGLEIPVIRGRQAELAQLAEALREPQSHHVCIVGPRYFGKTVLLRALTDAFSSPGSPYQVVVFWDLGHDTPQSDAAFEQQLAERIGAGLRSIGITTFQTQSTAKTAHEIFAAIPERLAAFENQGVRILIAIDDFDVLAAQPGITKDLWDGLRLLAERRSLRFAVASRRRLRDVIPSRDSRRSDFWNVFATTVQLHPFTGEQFDDFLAPMENAGYRLDQSARGELLALTGGVPVLLASACKVILDEIAPGSLDNGEIGAVETSLIAATQDILGDLLDDCGAEAQSDLASLDRDPHVCSGPLPPRRRDALIERGYAVAANGTVRPNCRLMTKFAAQADILAGDLGKLFGDPAAEVQNFKKILRNRLAQIKDADAEICGYVGLAIDALSRETRLSMVLIRSISEHAVQIAFEAEFPGGHIPESVQTKLMQKYGLFDHGIDAALLRRPDDLHARQTILRRCVGSRDIPKLSRKLSRPAMLLIDYLHNLGNYGQHMNAIPASEERPADFMFCLSACFNCIALLQRLTEDLN